MSDDTRARAAAEENEGLRLRLAEREEFIRQNAGPLLAERDAKIERQRAQLQRLQELYSALKLAHSGCRQDVADAVAQAVGADRGPGCISGCFVGTDGQFHHHAYCETFGGEKPLQMGGRTWIEEAKHNMDVLKAEQKAVAQAVKERAEEITRLRAALNRFAQVVGPDGPCFDMGGCPPSGSTLGTRSHRGRCALTREALRAPKGEK